MPVFCIMMRTTLNLPDDVYEVARSLAAARGISLGDALAELVRRGLNQLPAPTKTAFRLSQFRPMRGPSPLSKRLPLRTRFDQTLSVGCELADRAGVAVSRS